LREISTETPRVGNAAARSGPESPSRPSLATLPPDLAREGVRRLRIVAWAASGAYAFFILLGLFADVQRGRPSSRALELAASAIGIALSLLVIRLTLSDRVDARTILDAGLVYQVLSALVMAVGYYPFTTDGRIGGWSGVAVWVVTFPLLVPNTRGKVVVATIASALMDPLGALVHIAAGVPRPPLQEAVLAYAPTAIAAVLGIAISRMIHRISVEASRARELGISRVNLYELIGKYNLRLQEFKMLGMAKKAQIKAPEVSKKLTGIAVRFVKRSLTGGPAICSKKSMTPLSPERPSRAM